MVFAPLQSCIPCPFTPVYYLTSLYSKNRTQRMVIYYKFVGYLEIPSHLSAPNYKADLRQGVAVEYVSCEPTDSARELFDEDCEPVEEEQ